MGHKEGNIIMNLVEKVAWTSLVLKSGKWKENSICSDNWIWPGSQRILSESNRNDSSE